MNVLSIIVVTASYSMKGNSKMQLLAFMCKPLPFRQNI